MSNTNNDLQTEQQKQASQRTDQQRQKQQQQQQQASNKIQNNVANRQQNDDYQNNLKTLRRIVSQGSPIYEDKSTSKVTKDANGNDVDTTSTEKQITGYNYYAIDGKPIEQWVQDTFGGKVTLNKETKEVKINDGSNTATAAK
jgi:hypothetical protein